MSKPILSIGMIFRNEIRCLERCMKSLAPLREAVPCELVMADTGSDDGSREIAAKYADILFDFPWVNDFSAARNAVMDRCSGEWFFFLDCDEWLDADFRQLVGALRVSPEDANAGAVIVRNYRSYDEAERYDCSDCMLIRLLRMDTGLRFEGPIHESWVITREHKVMGLDRVILHHDGYVCMNNGGGQEKRERNLTLLRRTLEERPEDLRRLQEYLEGAEGEPDYLDMTRRAIALVGEKRDGWDRFGAPIYRCAVMAAHNLNLPETDEWIAQAESLFPQALVTQLDLEYIAFGRAVERKATAEYVQRGERWLKALAEYRAGQGNRVSLLYAALQTVTPSCEAYIRSLTAYGHVSEGNAKRAWELLEPLDLSRVPADQVKQSGLVLARLHAGSDLDTVPLLLRFWERLNLPEPSEDRAKERRGAFLESANQTFLPAYLHNEAERGVLRHACTLYAALEGSEPLGLAAAIMAEQDPQILSKRLATVEFPYTLPVTVLAHVLECGAAFPLPERTINLEEADALAGRLAEMPEALCAILQRTVSEDFAGNWQTLMWSRALALTAVQIFDWAQDDPAGVALVRTFVKVERAFLSACYSPEVLQENNLCILPSMHRFGWYCARAFETLDAGDAVGYVRLLQKGLVSHPGMKAMVEYLTDHTPQLQSPPPSGELLALAEQVRTLLSAYAPDDPAVIALKQSAAYQKVAQLIEGPDVFGGLAQ